MGFATDKLLTKLGRVVVPPHVRVVEGKTVKVDGYVRDSDTASPKLTVSKLSNPEFFPKLSQGQGAGSEERKRFVEYLKAHDWKMYHGTSPETAKKIESKGLFSLKDQGQPQMSDEEAENFDEPYIWDGLYLGSQARAEEFGDTILEIDLKGSGIEDSLYEFVPEDDEFVDAAIAGSIPPDRIKVLKS